MRLVDSDRRRDPLPRRATSRRAGRRELGPVRRELQMVFQDPQSSLNPRKRVGQIVGAAAEAARLEGARRRAALARAARPRRAEPRAPQPLPARVLAAGSASGSASRARWPSSRRLILLDEPVSALDVSIQAQVVNLLEDLQDEFGLSLRVRRPRPVGRAPRQRPDRRDVPRQDRRGLARRGALRQADPSVHGRAAGRDPDPRPAREPRARADGRRGRAAAPDRPAAGLPLPHPLPASRPRSAATSSRR